MTRFMDHTVSTSPVPTISIPISIPDAITPVTAKDLPSKDVLFIAEEISAKMIDKIIRRYFRAPACSIAVYYSPGRRARFLVKAVMRFSEITLSEIVSMFAENNPDVMISPVDEVILEDEVEINLAGCERLKRLTLSSEEAGMGKIVYLPRRSESLRHAS